jgi:hypothetical protein
MSVSRIWFFQRLQWGNCSERQDLVIARRPLHKWVCLEAIIRDETSPSMNAAI